MLTDVYREMGAGGFPHDDQIMAFFLRIRSLLKPDFTVVDFGAGRGLIADGPPSFARDFRILKGSCAKVIGVDVDPIVLENPIVDQALVIRDGKIPLPDESVDLIFSCAVFEHVEDPKAVGRELARILKPGGWICGWTVAKWGYVALGARLIPDRFHDYVLRLIEPYKRASHDIFPTHYRLNTLSAVQETFDGGRFQDYSYYIAGTPSYHANRAPIIRTWRFYNNVVPSPLKKNLHVFVKKVA